MTIQPFDSVADRELAALQSRAHRRRQRFTQLDRPARTVSLSLSHAYRAVRARPGAGRYALHLLVAVLVPLAYLASQMPLGAGLTLPSRTQTTRPADVGPLDAIAPLSLATEYAGEQPVPDSAFAEIDALPMPALQPELLRVRPVAATVAAEQANVRGGPGVEYDKLATLPADTALTLLARSGEWYKAEREDGQIVWVVSELLQVDAAAAALLPDATDIPAPPPAKVGTVVEEGLNLRDGPGTNYIGMTKLADGAELDLLARYGEWFQVQASNGQVGWVHNQFLTLQPGVAERVEAVRAIPDPNPALVGAVRERNVNLRGGPGTGYDKLGSLGNAARLELLGRYEDWLKVRAPQGTVGWVSSELVDVPAYVARRVAQVREIPALPQRQPVPKPQAASPAPRPAQPAPAPAVSASAGNLVEFAMQFNGARYVWGGASPKGFDCSGFVMYVYQQYGLRLPHSSEAQFSTRYGAVISNPADLAPGDIVFFVNTYKRGISHVGIYVGNGNVVQAMSPELGVGVASINGGYWAKHYYSAIRPSL